MDLNVNLSLVELTIMITDNNFNAYLECEQSVSFQQSFARLLSRY